MNSGKRVPAEIDAEAGSIDGDPDLVAILEISDDWHAGTLLRRLWRWYLSALARTGVMEAAVHRPPDRRSNSAKSETQLEAQARDDQ